MFKSLFTIATLALLLLFTSAYYTTPPDGRVGYQAPSLTLTNSTGSITLSQLQGHYVVITFWSSTEPQSRISNMQLNRAARQCGLHHVSINMDDSENYYQQLLMVDDLYGQWQMHCDSTLQENLRRTWRQESGYCSFLIDPQGRIILKDPTPQDLSKL